MPTRKYIGARYVPTFYRNSEDNNNSEWEPNVIYEPLTIVTYNTNVYTSKKEVPAIIGNPAQNSEYWAATGVSGAAVADLTQQVYQLDNKLTEKVGELNDTITGVNDNLTGKIDIINSNELILIGDSFGVDASSGGESWITKLLSTYPGAYHTAQGGAGFATSTLGASFLSLLQNLSVSADDKIKVKQIIVQGGTNDGNLLAAGSITSANIISKIAEFSQYVKTNYPNAIIKVVYTGWRLDNIYIGGFIDTREAYKSGLISCNNAVFYPHAECIFHNSGFINHTDRVHPTGTASSYLADAIKAAICGVAYKFNYRQPLTISVGSDAYSIQSVAATSFCEYSNEMAHMELRGGQYYNTYFTVNMTDQSSSLSWPAGLEKAILNIDGAPVGSAATPAGTTRDLPYYAFAPCITGNHTGTEVHRGAAFAFRLSDNKLIAKNCSGETANVYNLLIPDFVMSIPLMGN